eukprot:TRINITY_DN121741_c0_g1_i1.p1 TRINITY_DN121741_c0_g1~~TRINITY_DN121741_c0_g1_i1.p1  ORF type:complete len:472 (-),score=121.82 TRINITY_DN121741_c0_g1_i1:363-1778(-)
MAPRGVKLRRKAAQQLPLPAKEKKFAKHRRPVRPGGNKGLHSPAELQALLPRLWQYGQQHRLGCAKPSGEGKGMVLTLQQIRRWLQRSKIIAARRRPGQQPDEHSLRNLLLGLADLPKFRRRLGFRFQDPSKSGTWSMTNLVGHEEEKQPASKESNVKWDMFVVSFQLQDAGAGRYELTRTLEKEALRVRLEKRLRKDSSWPTQQITITSQSRVQQAEKDKRKRIRVLRKAADLLPAVVFWPASSAPSWTLIYLHGLEECALGKYADKPHYFFDGSVRLKVVCLTAPSRELSCYDKWWEEERGVWKMKQFYAWYDYLSNADGKREDPVCVDSLEAIRKLLHAIVAHEADELGGRFDRVLLGGKSQGCCTALDAALTCPQPLGGFIGMVGHLLSCTPVAADGPQKATPLHFFHEPTDHLMRWSWVQRGEQRLRQAKYKVYSRHKRDPEGCGHFIEGVEGAWMRSALRSICHS